ncbi:photosystem I assembly protein ycf4 [Gossypium australe]|uniref:Photosystem I assembly protein Ycf4 n=1 Tax=Gossypium australe TaxID=47621 RepID=A0A5B6VJH5_9ROSI|nr:photosystem I assembly protein ycf4 [Gossypium australe]
MYELAIRIYMDRIYSGISKNKQFLLGLYPLFFFFGSLGFLLVETSSYLGRNLISLFSSKKIDRSDRKEGIVCVFHWGFPRKNHHIFLRFLMKDIQSIRIEVKEGIYARHVLYMEIRGQGAVHLTRTD